MYKKILSLTLVFLMVCSCFVLSVSAEESLSAEELLIQEMKEAYIEQWLKDYGASEAEYFDGTLEYFYYLGEAGCHVFQAAATPGSPVEPTDIIGDYRFTAFMCMSYCDTNPSGTYAYKDGELMTLKEAYNKGLVDLDALYEVTESKYTMTRLSDEEILENRCKAELIEEYNMIDEGEDYVKVHFAVKFANYTIFSASTGSDIDGERYINTGRYWIYGSDTTEHYTLDNYGNVETLAETHHKGFIDMDEIFPTLVELTSIYRRGDVDGDKEITVKDATLIQKYLAKIPEAVDFLYSHPIKFRVADSDYSGALYDYSNSDEYVNIKDATYIQKKVAKIFEDKDRQGYSYGSILVTVEGTNVPEYTLEDFPEFDFESIDRRDYKYIEETIFTLHLVNPSKENVIDAINSLKYRVGVDIDGVSAEYLDYSG